MVNSFRYLPPDAAQRQQEKTALVTGALAAMRAVRANAGAAVAPPLPPPLGMGAASPGVPPAPGAPMPPTPGPAVPVALGGPPLPPPSIGAPASAPAPIAAPVLGGTSAAVGDLAMPTEMTAPSQFFADGGMVEPPQDDLALPPELERLVIPDTMLFEVFLRAKQGQPLRFAEGGLVMDTAMPVDEPAEERELLRQMSEAEPPPSAFLAFLDAPSDLDNEIVSDLLAAYQANPQSAPLLFQLLKGLAQEEPQALPPALLQMVGGGSSTGGTVTEALPKQPGPMVAKRPPESQQYAAKGKRKGGVPMPPGY